MLVVAVGATLLGTSVFAGSAPYYTQARWDPIHFKPAIETATDEQCLACHKEVLERLPHDTSPAGLKRGEVLAWYQTLASYQGEQETFHRRHLVTPLAQQLMTMKCTTCHQGNDPREESPIPSMAAAGFTLRKSVDPQLCLMCHGKQNIKIMGLPAPWSEVSGLFQESCLTCHAAIRTTRHQVNFLKADAIEEAGKADSDVCYGCHGGRTWYRVGYDYPRHAWPGMAPETPEWAKDRPTESPERFRR